MFEYLHEQIVEQSIEYEKVNLPSGFSNLAMKQISRDDPQEVLNRRAAEGWRVIAFQTFAHGGEVMHRVTYERLKTK